MEKIVYIPEFNDLQGEYITPNHIPTYDIFEASKFNTLEEAEQFASSVYEKNVFHILEMNLKITPVK